MAFTFTMLPEQSEFVRGDGKWDLIENIRHILSETLRTERRNCRQHTNLADEAGSPPPTSLGKKVKEYFKDFFPNVVQSPLSLGFYGRTESTLGRMMEAVEEKKQRMTITISSAIFETWQDNVGFAHKNPDVLGAILTITILHEIVHVLRRIFCKTWTPESLTGSHAPSATKIVGPSRNLVNVWRGEGDWEWEETQLGEMRVAFEAGAVGEWDNVVAIGFARKANVQWVDKSEVEFLRSVIDLEIGTLQSKFTYSGTALPPYQNAAMFMATSPADVEHEQSEPCPLVASRWVRSSHSRINEPPEQRPKSAWKMQQA